LCLKKKKHGKRLQTAALLVTQHVKIIYLRRGSFGFHGRLKHVHRVLMFANRRVHLAQSKHARFFGHHVRLNVFHAGTVQSETHFQNRFCFRVTIGSCQTIAQTQISHCNNNDNIKKGTAVASAVGSSGTLGQRFYGYYFEYESNNKSSYSKNDSE